MTDLFALINHSQLIVKLLELNHIQLFESADLQKLPELCELSMVSVCALCKKKSLSPILKELNMKET